jgi:hypothetical protein
VRETHLEQRLTCFTGMQMQADQAQVCRYPVGALLPYQWLQSGAPGPAGTAPIRACMHAGMRNCCWSPHSWPSFLSFALQEHSLCIIRSCAWLAHLLASCGNIMSSQLPCCAHRATRRHRPLVGSASDASCLQCVAVDSVAPLTNCECVDDGFANRHVV